jgi:hypothetical protein
MTWRALPAELGNRNSVGTVWRLSQAGVLEVRPPGPVVGNLTERNLSNPLRVVLESSALHWPPSGEIQIASASKIWSGCSRKLPWGLCRPCGRLSLVDKARRGQNRRSCCLPASRNICRSLRCTRGGSRSGGPFFSCRSRTGGINRRLSTRTGHRGGAEEATEEARGTSPPAPPARAIDQSAAEPGEPVGFCLARVVRQSSVVLEPTFIS